MWNVWNVGYMDSADCNNSRPVVELSDIPFADPDIGVVKLES